MSQVLVAEEEVIHIESEEEDTCSNESAYSSEEDKKKNNNNNTHKHSSSVAKTLAMEKSPTLHDTSQFEKELQSKRNNFISKYIKNGGAGANQRNPVVHHEELKNKSNKPLETKSQRDSIHLTRFKIDEEDIIDFGKPLTSTTTSAIINIQSKMNPNFDEIEIEEEEEDSLRRHAISSRDDDLIKLEDVLDETINKSQQQPQESKDSNSGEEIGITTTTDGEVNTIDPTKTDFKKELSFYQKWFNFYKTEDGESKTDHETQGNETKTAEQLPVFKIAILGEDLSDSLIAAEFIQEDFKKSTNSEEGTMKKQFDFGGKPYQLELFFYDMYEQFVNMMDQCLKECDGFLIVYNVASRRSFQQVDILYDRLYKAKNGGTISMVLVGIEYTNKTNAGSPPSTTSLLLQRHSTNQTPITNHPSPVTSTSVNKSSTSTSGQLLQENDQLDLRKASIVSLSSANKYWNNNSSMSNKHHSYRSVSNSTCFVTSQNGKERQVSKREGLKKSLHYYVPFIEMNSDEPKTLIQQKVKEIFHDLLREIIQGGNLRFSAVKPIVMTNSQYVTSQLGSLNDSEKSEDIVPQENFIPPNHDSYHIVMNSVKALFTNLNVHGYCLNTPINDEKELEQIEFLVDHFESHQVTCKVIEICLKRFDFRNVKLKLKQKVTPHNEQQILSFLFDIPLKKKNILQMMFTKSDENYQREINERLIFAIFIATFAKQLYSEQNHQLYDGTFMVSLEDEWNFILNLKNLFETVKKKVKEYSTLEELVEDQVIRMVDWMEKKIHLKRGNEIEMLMKFLLQHVTSPVDCYGFERRVRPHVLGNRYLILKRIFSNHHSKIYKSVKVKTSSICALKHLTNFTKSDLAEIGKGVESMIMFPKHVNVMTFTDYTIRRCRSDRFEIFIELPYMNASNMEKRLEFMIRNNRYMNYLELIDVYLQTTKGLQHLHQHSIVFPSLKLEKILMNYNEEKEPSVQKSSATHSCVTPGDSHTNKSDTHLLINQLSGEGDSSKHELKSVIIKAFDENDSLLGDQYKSNMNVKLTDWFKPWDFSVLDGTLQFKNRQVMEQFHNKNLQLNEWSTVRSTTPTSTNSHSTLRKQMVLHEIMSSTNNTHQDRLNFDGDIERYLDEKDDIFRMGCVFYQLITKESFIKWSSVISTYHNNNSSDNSVVSSPTSATTTVIIRRGEVDHQELSNPPTLSNGKQTTNNSIHSISNNNTHNLDTMINTSQPFEYVSIEEAIARDEKLTHQIMASKIHMSLLKGEAIPHLTSPRLLHNNHTSNSSSLLVGHSGMNGGLLSEASSPLSAASSLASPTSAERISPPSTSNAAGSSGSLNIQQDHTNHHEDTLSLPNNNLEKSKKAIYHCSHNNEQLLIGLIQQMLRVNPNQRPTLKKIILILEVLMKYNQIDLDIVETLLSKQ